MLESYAVHAAIRGVHVLGMALALGGAVLVWLSFRGRTRTTRDAVGPPPLFVARQYEWLFWGALSVIVMTGVGNLGALAPTVPAPETDWGGVFTMKIVAVGGLLVGSLLRTLLVAQYVARASASPAAIRLLQRGYGLTALYLFGLFGLAEVLVHGG